MLPSASQKQKVPLLRQRKVSRRCSERLRPLISFFVIGETSFFFAFTLTVVIFSDFSEFFFIVELDFFDVAFSDDLGGHDAVIDEQEIVNDGAIQVEKVADARAIATADNAVVDMVAAVLHTLGDTLDGKFWTLQPEVNQA